MGGKIKTKMIGFVAVIVFLIIAGNNPVTLKGKNCGVFIGIHFLETEVLVYNKIQKGASLAISRSFNANRISYWLGIHGSGMVMYFCIQKKRKKKSRHIGF